jgi:hypothetical protein
LSIEVYASERLHKREIVSIKNSTNDLGLQAHFGLGNSEIIDSVIAYWPSGTVDKLFDVKINQRLQLYEGQSGNSQKILDQNEYITCNPQDPAIISVPEQYGIRSWSTGDSAQSIEIYESGVYWVDVIDECIVARDSFEVFIDLGPPIIDLGEDRLICETETISLDASFPASSYLWNDEDTQAVKLIDEEGFYSVTVINDCGTDEFSIDIEHIKLENLIVPNVITPGRQDNINDTFRLPTEFGTSSIVIFNRWGKEVYRNSFYDNSWNGSEIAAGTYFYECQSICFDQPIHSFLQIIK